MPSRPAAETFRVASPTWLKALLLALVGGLGFLVSRWGGAFVRDRTLAAIGPFLVMIAAAAAAQWPRRLLLGRDGVAIAGVPGAYRSWGHVVSIRVRARYRGRLWIALACEGAPSWTIEPFSQADAEAIVEQMEVRRAAFGEGRFASVTADEGGANYRVAAVEPHVRVIEDPRNPLEARVAAARSLAGIDRAQADALLGELLEDTAEPGARKAFGRI